MNLSHTGFEYLRPPFEASTIQHQPSYIKAGNGDHAQRNIFYGVALDDFELSKIREVEGYLQRKGVRLPSNWNERETLRHLYGTQFNISSSADKILECLKWRSQNNTTVLTEKSLELLESGVIYTYGRDQLLRPIVIIDIAKIANQKFDLVSFVGALSALLDLLRQYCFVPGKVENWNVIIDVQNQDITRFSIDDFLSLTSLLVSLYPITVNKLFIVNPSSSFKQVWSTIKSYLSTDTLIKAVILEGSQSSRILESIPRDQLENRFGGSLPNLTKFWIPRVPLPNISQSRNQNLEQSLSQLNQKIENIEDRFKNILSPNRSPERNTVNYPPAKQYSLPYDPSQPERNTTVVPRNYSISQEYSQPRYTEGTARQPDTYFERNVNVVERSPNQDRNVSNQEQVKKSRRKDSDEFKNEKKRQIIEVREVKSQPVKQEPEEHDKSYDLNDKELLNLIVAENNNLYQETKLQYLPLNMTYQDLARGSEGHYVKTFKDYEASPERKTQITSNIITRNHDYEGAKKSSYQQTTTTTYVIDARNLPPQDHSSVSSSQASRSNIEEWSYQKYAKRQAETEEDVDDANFCGFCVSRRRMKPKHN